MTKSYRLGNGIHGACETRRGTGFVTMQVVIRHGALNDRPSEWGLSNLMQETCPEGTRTRKSGDIIAEIEAKGGILESLTMREYTLFRATALTRHAQKTFAILSDVVLHPSFTPAAAGRIKKYLAQALDGKSLDIEDQVNDNFLAAAWRDQAMGRAPEGSKSSIAGFTPAQLHAKHAEMLARPENIAVVFTGDISATKAQKMTQRHFGRMQRRDIPLYEAPAPVFTGGEMRKNADMQQTSIAFGFEAPSANSPDKAAATMFDMLFAGTMDSPLFREVRGKRNLAYSPGANHLPFKDTGAFIIDSQVGKGKAGELMRSVIHLMGKMARTPFNAAAMAMARASILQKRTAETSSAAEAGFYHATQLLSLGRLMPEAEYAQRLAQVTPGDIRRIPAMMLQKGVHALSAGGPQETLQPPEKIAAMIAKEARGLSVPPPPAVPQLRAVFNSSAAKNTNVRAPRMTVLENGFRVVTQENAGLVYVELAVRAGSMNETRREHGAAHLYEHMEFIETPSYKAGDIDRLADKMGCDVNAQTSRDQTSIEFSALLPEAMPVAIHAAAEMAFAARVTRKGLGGPGFRSKGERGAVLEEIRQKLDDAGWISGNLLIKTAYGDTPYGRPVIGTARSVNALTPSGLRAWHDVHYGPDNAVLSVAGPVRHEDVVACARQAFGGLERKNAPMPVAPVWQGGIRHTAAPAGSMAIVTVAAPAVPEAHPDYYAYILLGRMLGITSSALSKDIVERKGLAPAVDVAIVSDATTGVFYIEADTAPRNIRAVIAAACKGLRDVGSTCTERQLASAKAGMEMDLLELGADNGALCAANASETLSHGRPVSLRETLKLIEKVTLEDIRRVAKTMRAANPAVAIVTPPGMSERYLPTHDEVIAMRDGVATPRPRPGKLRP